MDETGPPWGPCSHMQAYARDVQKYRRGIGVFFFQRGAPLIRGIEPRKRASDHDRQKDEPVPKHFTHQPACRLRRVSASTSGTYRP